MNRKRLKQAQKMHKCQNKLEKHINKLETAELSPEQEEALKKRIGNLSEFIESKTRSEKEKAA